MSPRIRIGRLSPLLTAVATLGPVGRLPASGTWGSLVALLAAPWLLMPLSPVERALLVAATYVLGARAAESVEKATGRKDPSEVVIDEVLGMWLTLMPFTGLTPPEMALGFVLFRALDILKPWPIRWCETCRPGGDGVMLDDACAGVIASGLLHVCLRLWAAMPQ